ncbi:MAG: glycosyltransferase [Bacteroidales bacterium]
MRILQLIDSLGIGGAERMCVNIANVLHEDGYEVYLCATRAGGPLERFIDKDVNYFVLNKRSSLDILAFRKFIQIIRSNKIDVIHAHSSSLFWAVAAKFFFRNLKVIWHDHLGVRIRDRKKNPFYRLLSVKIDAVISVNDELADWSRKNMKVSDERIQFLNNFPLLTTLPHHPDPDYFTIVCLANIRPQKDHATLIKAIGILAERKLPKKLQVILAGSYDEDEYFNELRTLVQSMGLKEIIEFRGQVEDTATLLASADCGVLSSVSEGLPVSLLEYGMAGLPVVVTDVGQCAEVVDTGKFGRIVPPGDADVLANELFWIIQNRDSALQMGDTFRKHVNNEYGPVQFMRQYYSLLDKIIER